MSFIPKLISSAGGPGQPPQQGALVSFGHVVEKVAEAGKLNPKAPLNPANIMLGILNQVVSAATPKVEAPDEGMSMSF